MSEQPAVDLAIVRGDGVACGDVYAFVTVGAELTLGVGVATFARAYCEELGKRFGGTTADWISKVKLRRVPTRPPDPAMPGHAGAAVLEVPVNGVTTSFEVAEDDDLPDEAKLALIDLDLTAKEIKGHRLKWDYRAQEWVVADQGSVEEG